MDAARSNGTRQTAGSQEAPTYSLVEAAALLGCSVNTLRRRIAGGSVRAERVGRPQGYVWRVLLDLEHPPTRQAPDPAEQQAPSTLQQPPAVSQAAALAAYADQLQRPLLDRLEALVRENEQLRAQLQALPATATQNELTS